MITFALLLAGISSGIAQASVLLCEVSNQSLGFHINSAEGSHRVMLEWNYEKEIGLGAAELVDREREVVFRWHGRDKYEVGRFLLTWGNKRIPIAAVRSIGEQKTDKGYPVDWQIQVGGSWLPADVWLPPEELERWKKEHPNAWSISAGYTFENAKELADTEALVREIFMFWGYGPPPDPGKPLFNFTRNIDFVAPFERLEGKGYDSY